MSELTVSPGFISPDVPIFREIVDRLKSSRLFDRVVFTWLEPSELERNGRTAWIQPWKWSESEDSDHVDSVRTVTYRLWLNVPRTTSSANDFEQFARYEHLAESVRSALVNQPLPGCYLRQTRISEATYIGHPGGTTPERGGFNLFLTGRFVYDRPVLSS